MSSLRPATRVLRNLQRPAFLQNSVRTYASKNGDIGPNKTHTTDKPPYDVQSTPSNQAREARQKGEDHSQATVEKDAHNSNKRADQETKAPKGTVIGMNDERGSKGL